MIDLVVLWLINEGRGSATGFVLTATFLTRRVFFRYIIGLKTWKSRRGTDGFQPSRLSWRCHTVQSEQKRLLQSFPHSIGAHTMWNEFHSIKETGALVESGYASQCWRTLGVSINAIARSEKYGTRIAAHSSLWPSSTMNKNYKGLMRWRLPFPPDKSAHIFDFASTMVLPRP